MSLRDESRAVMTSVARMYYLNRLGQSEIANIYGMSRSTVSRLLTAAREQGIVRISVDDYDPRDRELEHLLTERFGLHHAIVIRGVEGSDSSTARAMGYFAAPVVEGWIAQRRSVGLAGGRTLGELVRALGYRTHPEELEAVQLMGMIGSSPSSVDASELTRALSSRFHGTFYNINAPVFVESPRTRDMFLSHAQIRSVWSRFDSLDLAFVGIGTLEESVFVERHAIDDADFAVAREAGCVGEICGRFFDATGRECDTPLRDRVISIELKVLQSLSEVVAVTAGRRRGPAVHAALNSGLVNSIVIDDAGAAAVLELS